MNKEQKQIRVILIDFAESIGYDESNPKHESAYRKAFNGICDIIDFIDLAERC